MLVVLAFSNMLVFVCTYDAFQSHTISQAFAIYNYLHSQNPRNLAPPLKQTKIILGTKNHDNQLDCLVIVTILASFNWGLDDKSYRVESYTSKIY